MSDKYVYTTSTIYRVALWDCFFPLLGTSDEGRFLIIGILWRGSLCSRCSGYPLQPIGGGFQLDKVVDSKVWFKLASGEYKTYREWDTTRCDLWSNFWWSFPFLYWSSNWLWTHLNERNHVTLCLRFYGSAAKAFYIIGPIGLASKAVQRERRTKAGYT